MSIHWRAYFWGGAYAALCIAPLVTLLLAPTPAKGSFWWEVGIGLGFAGLTMLVIQLVLTARFRIDVIYYFHRYIAYVLLVIVFAHPLVLLAADSSLLRRFGPWFDSVPLLSGLGATVGLLVIVASSVWRRRLRSPYGVWRPLHLALALSTVALAFAHMHSIGYYSAAPGVRGLWAAIGASVAAVVLVVRVIRPALLLRRPYRVAHVQPEAGDAWTVTLTPEGHSGMAFQPGQFAWVSLGQSPFALQEHPFSIASRPNADGSLAFTIKALGDFTATIGALRPGVRAFVDGPYGAFAADRYPAAVGYVFIAGGIGVAPILSMLEALAERGDTRRHILLTAHSRWDRIPCRDRLASLRDRLDLDLVFVLEEPHVSWTGERGRITAELLKRHLPAARRQYEYFLCGPRPMTDVLEHALHAFGIPLARIHTELFGMV
jgi:predicted ferric reductase